LKGKVYKKKMLNPKRLKGFTAFFGAYQIYAYLPYLIPYVGPTFPILAGCAATIYGMLAFSE